MHLVFDMWSLWAQCAVLLSLREPRIFLLTLLRGVGVAAALWWACNGFARLWNTRWRLTPAHHVTCAVAALLTFTAATLFGSLGLAKDAALQVIATWQEEVTRDTQWQQAVFRNTYDGVKAVGKEDFRPYPAPADGGRTVPLTAPESKLAAAEIYADAACKRFTVQHPFLARVVWPPTASVPRDLILADVNSWFDDGHDLYRFRQAVALAASQIRRNLESRVQRVTEVSRLILCGVFLLAQAAAFGLVAYAAYHDVKSTT